MQILPQLVRDVLSEYNAALASGRKCLVSDLATQHNIGIDTVQGIIQGRYDYVAGIKRDGKVRVLRGIRTSEVMLYDSKGYAPSGKSIAGAMEISQDGLYLKCHECGEWFPDLSRHVGEHDLTAKEYKIKHRLKNGTALVNEPIRIRKALVWSTMSPAKRAALGKARQQALKKARKEAKKNGKAPKAGIRSYLGGLNLKRKCPVQTLHDLRVLADKLGRQPSTRELKENNISHAVIRSNYGTITKACALIGNYAPVSNAPKNPNGGSPRWYSKKELTGIMTAFGEQHGRQPFDTDCKRGLLPSYNTFVRYFGSWDKALRAAGFNGKMKPHFARQVMAQQPKLVNGYYA